MKRIIILTIALFLNSFILTEAAPKKTTRELFKNNEAIIYTINIRNFGAVDKNLDGLINPLDGDIKGTFLNAKDKLKALKDDGINTIYLLPITPSGKLKALGTAGSLYAMDSFNEISPDLDDLSDPRSSIEEAKEFVQKAHGLGLNVIVDLPSCGSYDLSIKKPSWFEFDKEGKTLTPADWTDVRLFRTYNLDKTLYEPTLENFKSFADFALSLGFDGIRADVAAIKPYEFWKKVIDYTRQKNPDFLFLAEASPTWSNPAKEGVSHYSSIDELLNAGFDSYYGSFSDYKNIKTKAEFDQRIISNLKILKKHPSTSIISALATHDQQAPILRSKNYWNQVLWLSVTLPLNTYFLDGFSVGDDFIYDYENQKASYTNTDDEYYFVHSGLFDIFNYSAPVRAKHPKFKQTYLKAIDFKQRNLDLIQQGKFELLKTNNENVFAYSITNQDRELIVVGSLDEKNNQKVSVKSRYLKKDYLFSLVNSKKHPKIERDIINTELEPLELQVYMISLSKYRAMQ